MHYIGRARYEHLRTVCLVKSGWGNLWGYLCSVFICFGTLNYYGYRLEWTRNSNEIYCNSLTHVSYHIIRRKWFPCIFFLDYYERAPRPRTTNTLSTTQLYCSYTITLVQKCIMHARVPPRNTTCSSSHTQQWYTAVIHLPPTYSHSHNHPVCNNRVGRFTWKSVFSWSPLTLTHISPLTQADRWSKTKTLLTPRTRPSFHESIRGNTHTVRAINSVISPAYPPFIFLLIVLGATSLNTLSGSKSLPKCPRIYRNKINKKNSAT